MQFRPSVSASDLQAFLGAPEQLLQQPVELQLAVASFADTPRSLLEVLVNSASQEVAEVASLHVNWAGEITDWQRAIDEILQSRQMGQNDRLAVELLKLGPVPISFFSKWVPAERLIQGLRNPHIPLRYRLQLLERLAQEPTLEPRLQVAEAPETPLAVLEQLAGDLELPVRLAVKFNPSCPPQLIELVEGQRAVASNWNTSIEELAILGQSRWAWIRLAVAQNPNANEQTLMQLAQDKIYKIQLAVAQNPNASTETLMHLVKSEVHEIQLAVAKNIGASVDVLNFLAHQDTEIQAAVAEHRNITEEIMHQILPNQQIILEKRKDLPVSILERIFHEKTTQKPVWKDYYLRNLFLSQTNTPAWILAELANVDLEALRVEKREQQKKEMRFYELTAEISEKWVQDDIRFLADIAQHPQVSVEILERLLLYPNNDVQFAVAQNSLISEHVRIQILEALVNTTEEKIIQKLAASANTPVSILEKIALCERYQDKFQAKLRRILTRNPNQDNRESIADCYMDEICDILIQHQVSVDEEQWLTIIASYQWTTLIENYTYFGQLVERFYQDKDFSEYLFQEWSDLLPTLTEQPLKQIISNVLKMSDVLSEVVKGERSIAVALVGNPSTPVNLREELEERLTKPIEKLCSDDNDSDMRMALAYNPQIPKTRRLQYFQELLATRHIENIASNPNTPPEIIAKIMKKGVGKRQAVSKNPNAPISVLTELATDDDQLTCSQVAENSATPSDILVQLARQPIEKNINGRLVIDKRVRQAAFYNPNFPPLERYKILLETEQAQETANANQLMARRPDSPYAIAQIVEKGDEKAKLTAAYSPKTPIHILERLAKDADENIRIAIIENENTPSNSLLELASDRSYNIRIYLARSRHLISKDVSLQLLQHGDRQIRINIAKNLNTPVDILTLLTQDNDRNVKVSALANPNLPSTVLSQIMPQIQDEKEIEQILRGQSGTGKRNSHMPTDVLERLSQHPQDTIRYLVATYNTASATTLERLAVDKDKLVCEKVAENPSTPANVLIEMARCDELVTNIGCYHSISNKIAMRKDAPPEALEFIARKPVSPVRAVVAANINTPSSALECLAENESDESVLCIIARHPNITLNVWNHLATNESPKVREAVATQAQCPSNILTALADDSSQEVRQKVGANPNTPLHILESFSLDENPAIRQATASNPNLPETILAQLAKDEKVEVRRAVAQNPSTPASIRETLRDLILQPTTRQTSFTLRGLSRIYNPSSDDLPTILTEYAIGKNAFVRFVALLHPLTPQDILNQGARSASWLERYAVADNPATSTQIKQQLTQDSNLLVRAAATANS